MPLVDDRLDVARIARAKLDLNGVDPNLADAISGGLELRDEHRAG